MDTAWHASAGPAPTVQLHPTPVRAEFRGEDVVALESGFLVTGWRPGEPETPYLALLDRDLSSVIWEKVPETEASAILFGLAVDGGGGTVYVAGFGRHADSDGYDPLVLAIDESKPEALYHWVRASAGRIYAGGYGRSHRGEDTDVPVDVLDHELRVPAEDGLLKTGTFRPGFSPARAAPSWSATYPPSP